MAAKHLAMNKDSTIPSPTTPLAPVRVPELLRTLRRELGLNYRNMAKFAGVGATTLHDWTEGAPVDQIEALLRLLSRLPSAARNSALDATCPAMPSLNHVSIARDRLLTGYLRELLAITHGTTIVVGESEYLRTFVATALAHSFATLNPNQKNVSGYDVHAPTWFVPVDGVTYLNAWKRRNGQELILGESVKPAKMFFLNGVYSRSTAVRPRAHSASKICHVVIAEQSMARSDFAHFETPKHLITVSVDRNTNSSDDLERMQIQIREF